MAEYTKIINDQGTVLIDDSYQNHHLIGTRKHQVKEFTQSARFGGGGYYVYEKSFTVSSVSQPVVAYRALNDDIIALETVYEETSPNNWTVRMYIHMIQFRYLPNNWIVAYIYGLLPTGTEPSKGVVFQVFDANKKIVFDSGRFPMYVEGYYSSFGHADWYQKQSGYVPNSFPDMEWSIPNYDVNKVYAVVPTQHIFRAFYSNPNVFYYYLSYPWRIDNKFKFNITQIGAGSLVGWTNTDLSLNSEAFVLINVTGINV